MIAQEGSPSLAGRRPSFDHLLGDARLRDFKPQLEKFAMDAWGTPERIFDTHPADQSAQLRVDLRSPSPWVRLPTKVTPKAGSVPTHERLGPDDGESVEDCREPAIQLDKEPAILVRELDATTQANIDRYQNLLKTHLTELELQYLETRLLEERSAVAVLHFNLALLDCNLCVPNAVNIF